MIRMSYHVDTEIEDQYFFEKEEKGAKNVPPNVVLNNLPKRTTILQKL